MIAINDEYRFIQPNILRRKVVVGLCGDDDAFLKMLADRAVQLADADGYSCELHFYHSAEELLLTSAQRLDLLFLFVEIHNQSSLRYKERLFRQGKIWRIIFLSPPDQYFRYIEQVFGPLTLGFEQPSSCISHLSQYFNLVLLIKNKTEPTSLRLINHSAVIRFQDLLYVRASSNYIEVHTGKTWVFAETLKKFEEQNSEFPILRIHRSYVVNLQKVKSLKGNTILFRSGLELPVGRVYRKQVQKVFRDYFLYAGEDGERYY